MEGRIDNLEQGYQTSINRVSTMDAWIDELSLKLTKTDGRFNAIDRYMYKIHQYMAKETKWKEIESKENSPSIANEWPTPHHKAGMSNKESCQNRPMAHFNSIETVQRREQNLCLQELPLFEDPHGWLAKVERYFMINGLSEMERSSAVLLCFEGAALNWLQFRETWWPFWDWREFKEELPLHFGSSQLQLPQEELISLRQTITVIECREQFEQLAALILTMTDKWLSGIFIAGLKEDIQAELCLFGARALENIMHLALCIEARNWALTGSDPITNPTEMSTGSHSPNPASSYQRAALYFTTTY